MPRRLCSPATARRLAVTGLAVLAFGLTACDTDDGRAMVPPDESQRAAQPTTTSSTTTTLVPGLGEVPGSTLTPVEPFLVTAPWISGGQIDARYTCDGAGLSPSLRWSAPPAGTVELALLVTDDEAPDYIHWAVAGIAPAAGEVTEGATISGAIEGRNGSGAIGWAPPCPPTPGETHTYRVTVYALSQQSELPDDFTGVELSALAADTSLEAAEVIGTYTRAGAQATTTSTSAPVSTS